MKTRIVRWILSIGLLWLVYRETGLATTLAIGLCAAASELGALTLRRTHDRNS